ncbi:MAG: CRISPR-associated endonuclease Cas3'', partial [Caldisericia bacterium]|nr:CRISPR-associated endonuclease Cas3'' [Caldisericia bacterium]
MEFYSHKDTFLKDHLKEVAKRSKNYFYFKGGDDLKLISYYIGLSHDFGKYTTFFQKKLFDDSFKSKYSDHSLISSLFSYFLIQKNLEKFNIDGEIKKFLSLISFFVVIHHHTDLRCLDYLSSILENEENLDKINN